MVCGVIIIFLLGTRYYSLSAPDPVHIININLNLGEGANAGNFMTIIHSIDTSNEKRCQSRSVMECQAISINMDALNSPGPLILPNGDILTDGKTLNLYKHNWKRKYKPKNSFLDALGKHSNPRVFKTSENTEAMFTIIDGIATGSIPLKNNMLYTVEHNGNGQGVGHSTVDYNGNGQGVGYQLLIKRDTTNFTCNMDKPQMPSGSKWKDRYHTEWRHSDRSSGSKTFYDYQSNLPAAFLNFSTVLPDGRPKVDISITIYYTQLYEELYLNKFDYHVSMFNEANAGLHNSNIPIRFVPHCWIKSNIKEVDNPDSMLRILNNTEPSFIELSKDADIVILLVGDNVEFTGKANTVYTFGHQGDWYTTGVIRGENRLGSFIFGHEVSHLLGAGHNRNFIPNGGEAFGYKNDFFAYGHGMLAKGLWMTIMAYPSTS